MKGGFASRRRAEEFDALVSGTSDVPREEYADLLEVVGSMRTVPEVSARPEFVADLRGRLLTAAAEMSVEPPLRVIDDATAARLTPARGAGARERRLATIVGGFAVISATTSVAMASQGSLPGDVLYPMKRAIENAQTNLQSDDAAKADSLLGHAAQRLTEAEQLADDGGGSYELSTTLDDFAIQADQGAELVLDDYAEAGDERLLVRLREFTAASMARLGSLGSEVPADVRPAVTSAAQTVHDIDSAAWHACPGCTEGAVTDLPDFATASLDGLLLGPAPSTVQAADSGQRPDARVESEPKYDSDEGTRGDQRTTPDGADPDGSPGDSADPDDPSGQRDPLGDLGDGLDDPLDPDGNDDQGDGKGDGKDKNGDNGSGGESDSGDSEPKGLVPELLNGVTGLLDALVP